MTNVHEHSVCFDAIRVKPTYRALPSQRQSGRPNYGTLDVGMTVHEFSAVESWMREDLQWRSFIAVAIKQMLFEFSLIIQCRENYG